MIGRGRLRPAALLIAAVTLLATFGAGLGNGRAAEPCRPRSGPVVDATGAGTVGGGALLDPRIQRDLDIGHGRRIPHDHGSAGPSGIGPCPARSAAALAAVLERAEHPERFSQVFLRGPPGLSA